MPRFLIVDDHPMVREGVRAILARNPDSEVVGETGDGLRVAELVERLHPDVLILDVMLPGMNGIEVCRQVADRWRDTRVLMVSMHSNEAYVLAALRAGASGYLLKDTAAEELMRAAQVLAAGGTYLGAPFSERAFAAYAASGPASTDPYDLLTEREREVLQLAAEGHGNVEIGRRLFISPRTVEVHKANLLRKLGIQASEMVRYAIRRGVIALE